jgi:hypothetical protein
MAGVVATFLAQPASAAGEEEGEDERFEQAAIDFLSYCAPCHGRSGAGDGPVAVELVNKPADLTTLNQRHGGTYPLDLVRKRIDGRDLPSAHGTSDMPVWGYWFKLQANAAGLLQENDVDAEAEVKERIDRLVDYLATLQK